MTLISVIVVIFGAINWLMIGTVQFDIIAGIFGTQANIFSRLIYVFVGICGLFLTYRLIRNKGEIHAKLGKKKVANDLLSDIS